MVAEDEGWSAEVDEEAVVVRSEVLGEKMRASTAEQASSVCSFRGSRFWRSVPGKRTGSWARKV